MRGGRDSRDGSAEVAGGSMRGGRDSRDGSAVVAGGQHARRARFA